MLATCTASAPMRSMSAPTWIALRIVLRSLATGCWVASSLIALASVSLAHRRNVLMIGDDLLGHREVGPQQGLRRVLHRVGGQPAHLSDLRGQCG